MKVLIMGYSGFIGTNLMKQLQARNEKVDFYLYNSKSDSKEIIKYTEDCDFVFNFAAIHRPDSVNEFYEINYGLTKSIIDALSYHKNYCPILYTSSIQATGNSDYGKSKTMAEEAVIQYSKTNNIPVYIYRLTNTFGPGARPNGHSVIATFCNNIQKGFDITVTDRNREIHFYYIDDVIYSFLVNLFSTENSNKYFYEVPDSKLYEITLGELADKFLYFKTCRDKKCEPVLHKAIDGLLLKTFDSYGEQL